MRQLTDVCWRNSQQHKVARLARVTSPTATNLRPRRMRRARPGETRGEQSVFVHALSGAASFAACLRLFRSYPLALSPWSADSTNRSIVLRYPGADEDRASGKNGFFVLSQDTAEHFVLRPWPGGGSTDSDRPGQRGEFTYQEIRPVKPVPAAVHQVIAEGMPVPRDG